jgi:hypothetical protein
MVVVVEGSRSGDGNLESSSFITVPTYLTLSEESGG